MLEFLKDYMGLIFSLVMVHGKTLKGVKLYVKLTIE